MNRLGIPVLWGVLNVTWLLAGAGIVWGYPVGTAVPLEKMAEEADLIFKGTAVSGKTVEDDGFVSHQAFVTRETEFKIVSVIKGERPGDTLLFRHYDEAPKPGFRMFQPQYYHFEVGRTYLVFAKKGEETNVFRQLWMSHTVMEDQGVVLCANDQPVAQKTVQEVVWAELTAMLASARSSDVLYAIRHLDQMSGGRGPFDGVLDFDREGVLKAVQKLMASDDAKIAQTAIAVVGSHNPYLSDERTVYWLATVGSGKMPGIGWIDPKRNNPGGEAYWKELVALANSKGADEVRAMAILALGLVREASLKQPIERWLADPSPAVRAAAVLLLADFPGPEAHRHWTALATDASPEVRACVARAIGFGQQVELAEVLARLLGDQEAKVRQAAAMSLLSFAPKNESIAKIFRENLENAEFKPLFLNALARQKPADHLDALAKVVEEKTEPRTGGAGRSRRSRRGRSSFDTFRPSRPTWSARGSWTAIWTRWRRSVSTLPRSLATSTLSTCSVG